MDYVYVLLFIVIVRCGFWFLYFFFVNSVCCLGLVFLSEKNGDVDYKIVLYLKEKKILC